MDAYVKCHTCTKVFLYMYQWGWIIYDKVTSSVFQKKKYISKEYLRGLYWGETSIFECFMKYKWIIQVETQSLY